MVVYPVLGEMLRCAEEEQNLLWKIKAASDQTNENQERHDFLEIIRRWEFQKDVCLLLEIEAKVCDDMHSKICHWILT